MVEWTDFYLVLFLDFLLDCLCQLASQMTGPGPPGAARATLPLLDRCTSPFWDTSTDNSSSLSSTTSSLQTVKPACLTLPDRPAWMLQKDSRSLP